jgi:Spy/CpxP family protein refolding chaperone
LGVSDRFPSEHTGERTAPHSADLRIGALDQGELPISSVEGPIMRRRLLTSFTLLLVSASTSPAQGVPEPDFSRHVFAPELVMRYQQRIGLRPEQRTTITTAIQQLQSRVVDQQWRMQEEAQKLGELLQATPVNESAVLAQVDRVLNIERDVKRAHMTLLIRIKNSLTREQQAALKALRDST